MLHPDPFRDIDRLAAQLLGASPGSARVPLAMPMDLYRSGDHYVLHADLPPVSWAVVRLSTAVPPVA